MSWRRAFTLGFLSALLNVKVAVFFITFLAQFVTLGPGVGWCTAFLAFRSMCRRAAGGCPIILLVDRLRTWLTRARVRRAIERTPGLVLIGVGVSLAARR